MANASGRSPGSRPFAQTGCLQRFSSWRANVTEPERAPNLAILATRSNTESGRVKRRRAVAMRSLPVSARKSGCSFSQRLAISAPRSYACAVATCTTCGAQNADTARFCNACGAELSLSAAREVRKTVTVLFADVTGSTALGESLDAEAFRQVMARYFDLARGCLERHGGTVEKFIGDAVMAVFGIPTLHEDDALRALRAAADLRDALAPLNDELERDYGISLQLRTGVNTGEVVTGTEERLATGDAVNVAARLEQAAKPGEILIGDQTRWLARAAIVVEPVEPLSLKGKAEPLLAHRLVGVHKDAPAFERRLDAPLVGREQELAALRGAFETAVSERRCQLVTALGPPGIGKTRLARELVAMLENEAIVLTGRCLPYGEGITYWPLVEIFREAGAEGELAAALSAGPAEEIFWSVRKALERRSRERPLALVVEDIHWAEPTLLGLVEHLDEWTRDAPLLLLCLARPELLDARPAWGGQRITLEPLSQAESIRLMEELLGNAELEPETAARIHEAAGGNPLYVEQLLAMVAEGNNADLVPPTMQALLAARLDALPDNERELLERASVVGLEFEWEALAELDPNRRRPPGAHLAALVRKQLIRPHDATEDTFFFRHILIRDAAYERIPKAIRSSLHDRVADWLDGRGEEFDEIVGYHLEQAYRFLTELGPASERAQELGQRAAQRLAASGERAHGRGDTSAAANLLERAGALLPAEDVRRIRLLPVLGRVLRQAGRLNDAEVVLSEAVELGRLAGERGVVADAEVALTMLRVHSAPDPGVGQADVDRAVAQAIPIFEELEDEAGLARVFTTAGMLRFWRGESAAAIEDLDRAARHAREAGDWAQEAACLEYVVIGMQQGPTPVNDALARLDTISAETRRNRILEVVVLRARAELQALLGHFDAARGFIAEARALVDELGLETLASRLAVPASQVERVAGDPVAAERELRPACEAYERIGELGFLSSLAPLLTDAVFAQGRYEEALELSDRWSADRLTVPEDVDAHIGWRRVRAKILARRGDLEEAERLAREATALAATTDYLRVRGGALADLAEVLRLAGRPEEAVAALREAIDQFEEKGSTAEAQEHRALLAGASIQV